MLLSPAPKYLFSLHAVFLSRVVAPGVRCKELGGGGKKGDEEGIEGGRRKSRGRRPMLRLGRSSGDRNSQ